MNDEIKFTSLQDLYNRVRPALQTRVSEIKRQKIPYIKEEDIWNYLKTYKWNNSANLTLIDMINDILSVDPYTIDQYIKTNMQKVKREIIATGDNLL
ncbi:MAG TPA: post-transcriptional regulator [Bacilli bacterium]|nr:post-transcriptional regulator [Bacilli bacterium]